MMERWCRPFDYEDALDVEPANPCEDDVTRKAWLDSRKRRERERRIVGTNEHCLQRPRQGMKHGQAHDGPFGTLAAVFAAREITGRCRFSNSSAPSRHYLGRDLAL